MVYVCPAYLALSHPLQRARTDDTRSRLCQRSGEILQKEPPGCRQGKGRFLVSQSAIQGCLSNARLRKETNTVSADTQHSQIEASDVFTLGIALHGCPGASFGNRNNVAGLT